MTIKYFKKKRPTKRSTPISTKQYNWIIVLVDPVNTKHFDDDD